MDIMMHDGDMACNLLTGAFSIAVDTEAMGLLPHRDRLCLVQLSAGDGICHLIKIRSSEEATNLKSLLADDNILKIFHYARFDVAIIYKYLKVVTRNIYCTKIASKLVRTYTNRHSLKDLCYDLLGAEIVKDQGCSDWGKEILSDEQKRYAATDVLYLHKLQGILDQLLEREGRMELAQKCFSFLEARMMIDLMCGETYDIFSHN